MELKDVLAWCKVHWYGCIYLFTLFAYFCVKKLLTLQALQCVGTEAQRMNFAAFLALPGHVKKSRVWKDGAIWATMTFCFFWLVCFVGFLCFSSSLQPNSRSHCQSELCFTGYPALKKKVAFALAQEKDGSHVHGVATSFSEQSQLINWSTCSEYLCYALYYVWNTMLCM